MDQHKPTSPAAAGVISYNQPADGPEELIEGETRLGLMIQLILIGAMIAAIVAIVVANRLFVG